MNKIMNKELLLKYIEDTNNKNKHMYTYKYFKSIKKIIKKITINKDLTSQSLIEKITIYTQEYNLGIFGIYYIDFNIPQLLKLIDNNQLPLERFKSDEIELSMVYHEYPNEFSSEIKYNSKIIITDFYTLNCKATIIDGNHTFEKNINENQVFDLFYLPYNQIPRCCYCNDFSYVFHYLLNEFYIIFANQYNHSTRRKLIRNSKIFFMVKELL